MLSVSELIEACSSFTVRGARKTLREIPEASRLGQLGTQCLPTPSACPLRILSEDMWQISRKRPYSGQRRHEA